MEKCGGRRSASGAGAARRSFRSSHASLRRRRLSRRSTAQRRLVPTGPNREASPGAAPTRAAHSPERNPTGAVRGPPSRAGALTHRGCVQTSSRRQRAPAPRCAEWRSAARAAAAAGVRRRPTRPAPAAPARGSRPAGRSPCRSGGPLACGVPPRGRCVTTPHVSDESASARASLVVVPRTKSKFLAPPSGLQLHALRARRTGARQKR